MSSHIHNNTFLTTSSHSTTSINSFAFVFRYIKRGSDDLGDVANFVETEQIVQRADGRAASSFVQVALSLYIISLIKKKLM